MMSGAAAQQAVARAFVLLFAQVSHRHLSSRRGLVGQGAACQGSRGLARFLATHAAGWTCVRNSLGAPSLPPTNPRPTLLPRSETDTGRAQRM
ncbi:hypothetical protein NDU88_000360 [Pleurodeles waltl]|uniref:Secreted protein n=1 Tax=Pleurodeles waltl TaxID=8319 RepID=A0AAV7N995_PLEWA|nr:hypothetical protein NDU88_000360 [Pleurodeles waltl]